MFLSSCASWSTRDKIAAGFFLAGHAADYYTTEDFLDDPRFYEKNPILGKHPSDKKLVAYFSITAIGALIVAHYWEDARPWLLWGYGGVGFFYADYNRKLD